MNSVRVSLFVTVFIAVCVRGEVGVYEAEIKTTPRPDTEVNKRVPVGDEGGYCESEDCEDRHTFVGHLGNSRLLQNMDKLETRVRDLEHLLTDNAKVYENHIKKQKAEIQGLLLKLDELEELYDDLADTNLDFHNEIRMRRRLRMEDEERDSPSSHRRKKRQRRWR